MPRLISADELALHHTRESLWIVCDKDIVVDVTDWIDFHPGGVDKILQTIDGQRFSFSTHFSHTREEFERVAAKFMRETVEEPMSWTWTRSRSNGGLDRDGNPTFSVKSGNQIGAILLVGVFSEAKSEIAGTLDR